MKDIIKIGKYTKYLEKKYQDISLNLQNNGFWQKYTKGSKNMTTIGIRVLLVPLNMILKLKP